MSTPDRTIEDPHRPASRNPERFVDSDGWPDDDGGFQHVFGAGTEIPEAERAWRRTGEIGGEVGGGFNDAVIMAMQSLPTALREIRQEVRRAADLATDALATAASLSADGAGQVRHAIDPLPGALRELREEVREAGDRATEALAATRQGMEALPSLIGRVREELNLAVGRISEGIDAANQEAARAFSIVAREVRSLGDRQAVLREEVKLLGKRLEELERVRRRMQARPAGRLSPGGTPPEASPTPAH